MLPIPSSSWSILAGTWGSRIITRLPFDDVDTIETGNPQKDIRGEPWVKMGSIHAIGVVRMGSDDEGFGPRVHVVHRLSLDGSSGAGDIAGSGISETFNLGGFFLALVLKRIGCLDEVVDDLHFLATRVLDELRKRDSVHSMRCGSTISWLGRSGSYCWRFGLSSG